jgi:hypothetical protein
MEEGRNEGRKEGRKEGRSLGGLSGGRVQNTVDELGDLTRHGRWQKNESKTDFEHFILPPLLIGHECQ